MTVRYHSNMVSDETSRNGQSKSQFLKALETLREWILTGEVAPNQHLIEVDLAKALEVSRTTIRAVLLDLNKEGFITLEQNRGARVRSFTPEEAREVLVLRERLEGIAASLAAEAITAEEVEALDAIVEEMSIAETAPDPHTYAKLSRKFHGKVTEASRNPTLAKFIDQTRYQLVVRQFWNLDITHPRPESLDEHKAIVVALRGRDPLAAERIMRLHVSSARNALKLGVAEAEATLTEIPGALAQSEN